MLLHLRAPREPERKLLELLMQQRIALFESFHLSAQQGIRVIALVQFMFDHTQMINEFLAMADPPVPCLDFNDGVFHE